MREAASLRCGKNGPLYAFAESLFSANIAIKWTGQPGAGTVGRQLPFDQSLPSACCASFWLLSCLLKVDFARLGYGGFSSLAILRKSK